MLTLVLSCDIDGCAARQEVKTEDRRVDRFSVEDAGWRWRVWAAPGDWRLCCPEHAGASTC